MKGTKSGGNVANMLADRKKKHSHSYGLRGIDQDWKSDLS